MNYYISDLHLDDQKLFDKCSRPFSGLNELKETIIRNWNERVKEDDNVYLIGDIGNDADYDGLDVIAKLNGKIHLIIGNHDQRFASIYEKSPLFASVNYFKLIMDGDKKVFLCHFPTMDWEEFNRGGYHVYGHIHNKQLSGVKLYYKDKLAYNASADVIGFTPRTLDEMIALKEERKNEPYIN